MKKYQNPMFLFEVTRETDSEKHLIATKNRCVADVERVFLTSVENFGEIESIKYIGIVDVEN